jgi:uncharacterized protein involved in exopolysaccharide biosynthesis
LYLRYTPPVFQSRATLRIGSENKASSILDISTNHAYDEAANQFVGDIELLRSKIILERAVKTLPLEISYYAKGTVLLNELYGNCPFKVDIRITDSTFFGVPVFVDFPEHDKYHINYIFKGERYSGTFRAEEWHSFPHFDMSLAIMDIQSVLEQQNLFKQDAFFFMMNTTESNIRKYIGNVAVQLLNQSAQTIQIVVSDKNPKKCADLANAIAEEFIKYDLQRMSQSAENIIGFIDTSLRNINNQLTQSEQSLENFKTSNLVMNPSTEAEFNLDKINELKLQQMNADIELFTIARLEKSMQEKEDMTRFVPTLAGNIIDPTITNLITGLQALQNQKDQLLMEATPDNEVVKQVNARMDEQKELLALAIINARKAAEDRKQAVQNRIIALQGEYLKLPALQGEYTRLDRLYTINQNFYAMLLQKKAEFMVTKAGIVSNNLLMERASFASYPVSPNRMLVISSTVLVGIFYRVCYYLPSLPFLQRNNFSR